MGFIDPECEARYLLRDVHTLSARAIVAHHGLTVLVVPGLKADACFATIHGRPTICLRGKLSPVALRWALLHELAEWHLARLCCEGPGRALGVARCGRMQATGPKRPAWPGPNRPRRAKTHGNFGGLGKTDIFFCHVS